MTGEQMLHSAARLMEDRRKSYGDPAASMAAIAARWSLTLGRPVTPAQVVLCLIDLKLARLAYDPAHWDSLRDIAGYAAVLREVVR
jgi:alpha-D-ribose 1-methylphosphonate 5-triphosphate synthase subunit PhnI